jgi:hypothetical protein
MSTREWTLSKLEKWIREGRGQGSQENYKPWLTIQDVPSIGRVSREQGITVNRIHHFMSDLELDYFLLLDWSEKVIDIREQYPILEYEKVIDIAEQKGINYPINKVNDTPYILTSDFLITVKGLDNERINIVRTIKPSQELNKKRVIEKLELERTYWTQRSVDWGIITEREVPKELIRNLKWVRTAYYLEETNGFSVSELQNVAQKLKYQIFSCDKKMNVLIKEFSFVYKIPEEICLYLFRHLIANKELNLQISSSDFI